MKGNIRLRDETSANITCVSNTFIDNYMTKAPGDYVKIYLYLLRCINSGNKCFSIAGISEAFDYTEGDVRRGLAYWSNLDLIQLEYDENQQLCGICICSKPPVPAAEPGLHLVTDDTEAESEPATITPISTEPARPEIPQMRSLTAADVKEFKEASAAAQLLFIAERYVGRPLSTTDVEYMVYWYKDLEMSADLIDYLIATASERSVHTFKGIDRMARAWYEAGVKTVKQARDMDRKRSMDDLPPDIEKTVLNAFGIAGRSLGDAEKEYLRRWYIQWSFAGEMISLACGRALSNTGRISFEYADRILSSWKNKGIDSLKKAAEDDRLHKEERSTKAAPSAHKPRQTKAQDFLGHTYDYADLERKLMAH
ncbi:MAG: DnaD domain protein [Eubacterium sp.]|nr:DnaD domain protein [Eubacterium sp.]